MIYSLIALILAISYSVASAQVPPQSVKYLPILKAQAKDAFPEFTPTYYLAGQVEQETCPSLKSSLCWNPKTENKNPKNNGEYGFGLGQLTVTNRFNNFDYVKSRDKVLRTWQWNNRFDPAMQLRALVVMDMTCKSYATGALPGIDYDAMIFSCYNGGGGGLRSDRTICRATKNCDPDKWFNNVELTSNKSRRSLRGYSQSAFSINRSYPKNIIEIRSPKYQKLMGE